MIATQSPPLRRHRFSMPPSAHIIDYEGLLSEASGRGTSNTALLLQELLPSLWRDAYVSTISHEPNVVRFRHRTYDYICDLYSQLELAGSVPFDQTIADRVIAVFGKSSRAQQEPNAKRKRLGLSEELAGTERDDGHFMAHSIGGGLDVNLFSQQRKLNRGWSPQGKVYRRMEKYCYEQQGHLLLFASGLHRRFKRSPVAGVRGAEERRNALGRGLRQLSERI